MIFLGCDPGFRNFGLVLVQTNGEGKPKVLKSTTLSNGSIKQWQTGLQELLTKLGQFIKGFDVIDAAGVEMISWYGKRRGSLQLAHLAGGTVGYLLNQPNLDTVQFFAPKEVKGMSASFKAPKGFDEHQHDALSICRLLADQDKPAPRTRA